MIALIFIIHYVKSVHIRSFYGPIFPAFGLNTKFMEYLFVFSPNARKHEPEKRRIRTLFTQWFFCIFVRKFTRSNLVRVS